MTTPGPQGSMAPPQHDSNPSQGPPFNTGNPSHPQPPPGAASNQNSSLSNRLTSLNEQIWVQFGTSFELASEFDKAINAYEQALRHNPYSTNALQKIAMLYRSRECYDKAVDYFQRLLNINKSNGEAWGCLGHSYLMMDDLPKAYAAYQQALHFSEENEPRLWYGIGILYDRYGSLEHAESAFSSVIQGDPNFDKANEIYFRLGIIYKNQNKLDLSLQCFRYILNSPPKPLTEVDIWFQIGHVYEHQREYELAKEAYERVIQENPSHAKVLQQLGWLHQQQNTSFYNQEHAITLLNRSLDSDPSDAQTWYLLGRCYMSQQKFDKAYEAYQQAVYRDGRNPTFWCSIGVLYYQINQFRDALDAYSRAIRLNPYISEVWYDLGTLYESCNNQINDAIDAYQRASDLDPSNPHIKQRLAALRNSQAGGNGEGLGNENGVGSLPPGPQGPPPGVQSYPSHIPDNSKNIPPPLRRFNGELPPPGPGNLIDPPKVSQGNPFAKSQYGPPGHHRDDDPRMADSGPPSRPDLPRMASPHPMDHQYGSGMPQDQRMRSMKPDPLAPMGHQATDSRKMSIPINMAGRHPNPPPHHNSSLPPPRGNPDYPPYPGQEPSHHHSRLGHPPPRGDFDEYSRGTPYSGRPHPHQEPGYPGEPNSAYPHHPIISDPRRPSTGGPRGVPPSHPGHEEYGRHSSMHLPDIRSMERQGKPPSSAPWPHSNAMGHGGEHHYNRSEVSPKSMMPPHRPPARQFDDDYEAVNALVSIRGQSGKMQPPRRSPSAKPNDPHLKSHPNKPMSMGSNLSPATHSRHATPLPSRPGPYHSKPGNDGSEPHNLPPSQP